MAEPTQPPEGGDDVALLYRPTDDGAFRALRARRGRVEMSEVRPLEDGQPVTRGEVVSLHRRGETPLFDVEVHWVAPAPKAETASESRERTGPARVTSTRYRANWESVFGPNDEPSDLN